MWNFFNAQWPPVASNQIIYDDSLRNGWQDFSSGTVDFSWTQNVPLALLKA